MRSLTLAIVFALSTAASAQPYRIFFDWGKPEITRDSEAVLNEVAAAYAQSRPQRVTILGHSDRSGPAGVNLRASRKRAEAVRAYLAALGVPTAVMSISSLGETQPIVPTEDGVREAQNRRVEISFSGSVADSALGAVSAMVVRSDGSRAGAMSLTETGDKAWISVDVSGLAPGVHGMHLHSVGRCDTPDFATAGGHWNPTGRQHGLENPQGHHSGDLPNVTVGADGRLFKVSEVPVGSRDADGFSLVIHQDADDNRTDPSGNSGPRVACAAIPAR